MDAHGLLGLAETPLAHTGFSGATLTRLKRADGATFILKRMSIDRDWIMRATNDDACREATFARCGMPLGDRTQTPSIGIAADGSGHALLMLDITDKLLPQGMLAEQHVTPIIDAMARLHCLPAARAGVPWCDVGPRLTLLTSARAAIAESYGASVARDVIQGWRLFTAHATPPANTLIRALHEDPSPLLPALRAMPASLLHGDLKFDNIGLAGDGTVWLIDWALTLVAPPSVELGWFLAINSRRLPLSLDDTIQQYDAAARVSPRERERHEALTVLCGLLLRGWRKALDAEAGEPDELRWWCERAEAAARHL